MAKIEEMNLEVSCQQLVPRIVLRRWIGPSTIKYLRPSEISSDEESASGSGIYSSISLLTDSGTDTPNSEEPREVKRLNDIDIAKMLPPPHLPRRQNPSTGSATSTFSYYKLSGPRNPKPSKILKALKTEEGIKFRVLWMDGHTELGIHETLDPFLKINYPELLIGFYERHIEWEDSEVNNTITLDSSSDEIATVPSDNSLSPEY